MSIEGSITALVTPMNEKGDLDYNSLEKLITFQIDSGISGLGAVGTTGESATLTIEEHLDVIKHLVKYDDGRIPIIAGSGSNCTAEAIETAGSIFKNADGYAKFIWTNLPDSNSEMIVKYKKQ